jgi:ribonuclease VapC
MKVIDASALLAVLHKERGANEARAHLRGAFISAVNLSEVYQDALRTQTLYLAKALVAAAQLQIVAFDAAQAEIAAEIHVKSRGKGISFADRACLALGKQKGIAIVTADQGWASLDIGVELLLFRDRLH